MQDIYFSLTDKIWPGDSQWSANAGGWKGESVYAEKVIQICPTSSYQVDEHKKLRGGVHFVEKIPRNPQGKILRKNLASLLGWRQNVNVICKQKWISHLYVLYVCFICVYVNMENSLKEHVFCSCPSWKSAQLDDHCNCIVIWISLSSHPDNRKTG